jgi:hypothetical protein
MSQELTNKVKSEQIKEMITLYENGQTLEVGENSNGITRERVRQIFEKAGFKRRKQTASNKLIQSRKIAGAKRIKILPRDGLENLYIKERQSAKKIARFFECSAFTVMSNLIRYGIPIRSFDEVNKLQIKYPELTEDVLQQSYIVEDKTAPEIANEYDCSLITVKRKLRKFGIRKTGARD